MKRNHNRKDFPEGGIGDDDVKTTHYWLISPGYGGKWWDEFYIDYKDELNDDRETKLEWLIFECCSLAVDGECTEIE